MSAPLLKSSLAPSSWGQKVLPYASQPLSLSLSLQGSYLLHSALSSPNIELMLPQFRASVHGCFQPGMFHLKDWQERKKKKQEKVFKDGKELKRCLRVSERLPSSQHPHCAAHNHLQLQGIQPPFLDSAGTCTHVHTPTQRHNI